VERPSLPTREKRYFGKGLPYLDLDDLTGYLVVIEGSDGAGRSTQIRVLKEWLQFKGFGVAETGWTRSSLVGPAIDVAKAGHAMNNLTFNLLYATDLADRLEHEIIPALRSGFIVLSDRYVYTAMARAAVRGADMEWIRPLYGFAVVPDLVIYLKVDVNTLLRRLLMSSGLDYWEAGLDQNPDCDPYDSFRRYQTKLVKEYNSLSKEFEFKSVNAKKAIRSIQKDLRNDVAKLLGFELSQDDLKIGSSS